LFRAKYKDAVKGTAEWHKVKELKGELYRWDDKSTYLRQPPFFVDGPQKALDPSSRAPTVPSGRGTPKPAVGDSSLGSSSLAWNDGEKGAVISLRPIADITGARVLVMAGDSITTDHISPAGHIAPTSPAGLYLKSLGVEPRDFNSYGARRGNDQVMVRGTFANPRFRNQLAPGTEGSWTTHFPSEEKTTIFDASLRYQKEGVPLIALAGKEYGTGSSRDWAAKGPMLLGIRVIIAESFERIHRSNLAGMGILPLQFESGESFASLGLKGNEVFDILGLTETLKPRQVIKVLASGADGSKKEFSVIVRLDTPMEINYFRNGGILQTVLRKLAK